MFFSLQTIDCEKFSKYYSVLILIKIEALFLNLIIRNQAGSSALIFKTADNR